MPSYGQLLSGKKPTSGIGYHDRGSRPLLEKLIFQSAIDFTVCFLTSSTYTFEFALSG
jgi:hypothetical protein